MRRRVGALGFAVVEAGAKQLKVRFIDAGLKELYEHALTKKEMTGESSMLKPARPVRPAR